MSNEKSRKLEFRGGSGVALIPFAIFIGTTIALSFMNAADLNLMIGVGVISLLIGMIFAKDIESYWDAVLTGLGSKVGVTAVMLWLVVGIYGNILKSGHIVEGLVWLSTKLNMSGSAFTFIAFFFSALFAIATGSGFGTISTMSYILYPAGILLGSDPRVLAGAILSGAAVGDNLAPVSDTAIIASTTQEYTKKDGVASIGDCVKLRWPMVVLGMAISAVLFFIFGGANQGALSVQQAQDANQLLAQYQMPKGLWLLVPTAIVILLSVSGKNIFYCLGIGIVSAIVIGLTAGLFEWSSIISISEGTVSGAIVEGISGMLNVSILLMIVVAMGEILVRSGFMDNVVDWLNDSVIKTPRGAELSIFGLATIFGILIAAINTIANICVAPFINAIGKKRELHPCRRANILATTICSFPFFLPYGGCVLLLLGGLSSMKGTYPFLPNLAATDMMLSAFYPWVIWILTLISVLTGRGRLFEGENGGPVKSLEK